jgi:parvulin-like peptidyl-prolyl isomerase
VIVRLSGRIATAGLTAATLSVCLPGTGCGRDATPARQERASGGSAAGKSKDAVAVVDGRGIALSEVQELVRRSGLSARDALSRLEAERLLIKEAERHGFAEDAEVHLVAKRAAVQALLLAEADRIGVEEEELREAYEAAQDRFHKPERRESVHVLASMSADASPELSRAGEKLAREAIRAFTETDDVDAVLRRFGQRRSEPFPVVVERLPLLGRTGAVVKEFEEALFEPSEPGVVPRPVRTSYGWHAIYVVSVRPEEHWSFEQAVEQLRPEILLEKRTKGMEELFGRLEKNADIQTNKNAIEWLLKAELPVLRER